MTIKNIMLAMNVSPDVEITVYQPDGIEYCVYRGKYEDAREVLINQEVSEFNIDELTDKGYRKDVTKVSVFLDEWYR